MSITKKITNALLADEEVAFRRQADEAIHQVITGGTPLSMAKKHLQAIIVGCEDVKDIQQPKRNLAEERHLWFEGRYKECDFTLTVPKPAISNHEFDRRAKLGQALFYRPATSEMSYAQFMNAVGQAKHWTVVEEDRHKIKWEEAKDGYWFWAEIHPDCPRTGTSWNDLSISVYLLALEEYAIVWHVYKAETNNLLDRNTWTWLRTRFETGSGPGALRAGEYLGQVSVDYWPPECLSIPDSYEGGRLAEVVKPVA